MANILKRLKANPSRVVTLAVLVCSVSVLGLFLYFARINERISAERAAQKDAARVEVEVSNLRAPSTDGYTCYLNSANVRAVANYYGKDYLATSGGLVALNGGEVERRYTTLDGLPDNDLTSLATFGGFLFAGTARGLVSFDGRSFVRYQFVKPKATRVSVLASTDSELLIGTLGGGLFEFDGDRFSRRANSALGADFKNVTALLTHDGRLYIGTQDDGLFIWREARIEHIGTADGLPSPHVTGLAPLESDLGAIAVATDFAVVGLTESNQFKHLSNRANITSLGWSGGRLWAGLFSGGLTEIVSARKPFASPLNANDNQSEVSGLPRTSPTVVTSLSGKLWALTQEGAFVRPEQSNRPGFEPAAQALVTERMLSGEHITSLTLDGPGRLWVAYFDNGIDIISPSNSERLEHIEDDRVREVNHLRFDPSEDRIFAATSRGLVIFDTRLRQTVLTREQNGLIDGAIAHVAVRNGIGTSQGAQGRAIVLSTAGGLTEITGGRVRSITAFHGLASNHLYTSATIGSRLFLGSLAGLVELDGLRVIRTYKTSNSNLSHDWVTGLAELNGTLYVGTNGGGVDALLTTGEWVSFDDDVGRFEVNQNAMHIDGERLLVGTSDRGLLVYNSRARQWKRISSGFPSQSVTAITSDAAYIYAGTLNGLIRIEKRILE